MYSSVARTGRENQGARVVAGCVLLNPEKTKVLMVGAKNRDKWVLPKGGVETDEKDDYELAAARELWEEAGAKGKIIRYLGCIPHDSRNKYHIKNEFHFYEMELEKLEDVYPESGTRRRKWASFEEARTSLSRLERYELVDALERSNLSRLD